MSEGSWNFHNASKKIADLEASHLMKKRIFLYRRQVSPSVKILKANVDDQQTHIVMNFGSIEFKTKVSLENICDDSKSPNSIADECDLKHLLKDKTEGGDREPPHLFGLEMLLPASIASDYIDNLRDIYLGRWVPKYGEASAKRLWYRNCVGMVVSYWFGVLTQSVERIRKVLWSF